MTASMELKFIEDVQSHREKILPASSRHVPRHQFQVRERGPLTTRHPERFQTMFMLSINHVKLTDPVKKNLNKEQWVYKPPTFPYIWSSGKTQYAEYQEKK